jgi:hypothetical protein
VNSTLASTLAWTIRLLGRSIDAIKMPRLQPVSETVTALQKKKPGPKPKKIEDRAPRNVRVAKRSIKQYSRRKKIEVLVYLQHHRILCDNGRLRSPTQTEAARTFRIPQQTISDWVRSEQKIIEGRAGSIRTREVRLSRWPLLEEKLYELFLQERDQVSDVALGKRAD